MPRRSAGDVGALPGFGTNAMELRASLDGSALKRLEALPIVELRNQEGGQGRNRWTHQPRCGWADHRCCCWRNPDRLVKRWRRLSGSRFPLCDIAAAAITPPPRMYAPWT